MVMTQDEMIDVLKTAMQFASALGKHEGNIKFILENQDTLTKETIIQYLQDTYNEVNNTIPVTQ
jgi:plasmid maintenance system antidote protein VapI